LPGSNRTHSYSDAIYLGGVLNAEPSQYVKFANDGIDIVSPLVVQVNGNTVVVNADDKISLNAQSLRQTANLLRALAVMQETRHSAARLLPPVKSQEMASISVRTNTVAYKQAPETPERQQTNPLRRVFIARSLHAHQITAFD
jgi:hypothetical protein